MKKRSRLLALLLALVMVLSLAACSSGSNSNSISAKETEAETAANTETDIVDNETQESEVWEGEITQIEVYVMDSSGASDYADKVIDAMNAITETTIGVHANITYVNAGDYATTLSLAISGGEQVDVAMLTPIDSASFNTLTANGQLLDITEYLQEYGEDLLEVVGDYIDACSISGSIYGVPAFRNYSETECVVMRADILEELGLLEFAENMTTWEELEEIYAAVAENYDIAPVAGTQEILLETGVIFADGSFSDAIAFDSLSDSLHVVYTDENGSVSMLQENEDFISMCEMVQRWYENGWIYEDSLVTSETADTLIGAGVAFSNIETCGLGAEATKEGETGYDLVIVDICKRTVSSSDVVKFGLCVPVTAEEPEAAVRWMNAIYTSSDLMNLFAWGIEGEDYEVVDGEAAYPDDIDSTTVEYHTADYLLGNAFLAYPWDGNGSDYRERAYEALTSAPISAYLGFSSDQSDLTNVIAAITSVTEKYKALIFCGAYTDAEYEAYVEALKTAGAEDYLTALQEQLDEWIETN